MKINTLFLTIAALMLIACGTKQESPKSEEILTTEVTDDQTIYGLACDGCNDTVVVFLRLPYNGSNPDTLYILDAVKQRHIMGKIRIGDKLAIMRNETDSTVADLVIVTEQLMVPDSIKALLAIPKEYGLDILHDNMMYVPGSHVKHVTSDEESPVEYPIAQFYNEWKIFNGRFVMLHCKADSLGKMQTLASDTADVVLLEADSLMLRFKDGVRSYYRKVEVPKE
ncbi:hypothetical protein [uncultured Prevotella sp.]|uniref:hypothetical protein n=1 Tax=uncultured Prevotella sp. TaxID=159272 RepID=UPI002590E5A2|nr:hypothetical protein [uncultured Prevotella sp.]